MALRGGLRGADRGSRLRRRRNWLILAGLLLGGGGGLPVGLGLEAICRRLAVPPARRWAGAALWVLLWSLGGGGLGWTATFYHAAERLILFGDGLPAGSAAALAGGWLGSGLALAAALPLVRPLYRRPWDPVAERPLPPLRPGVEPEGAVDLGTDEAGRPALLADADANTHVLLLGATGSGKTNALLLVAASALRRGLPLVVIDGKGSGELRRRLGAIAGAGGRKLAVWTIGGGAYYNPLRHGEPSELRDKLIAAETWTEPHYRRAAERYLGTVLQALASLGRPANLAAVARLLAPGRLEALGRSLPPDRADELYAYLDSLDASGRSAVAGLANRLATLVASGAGPWLDVPEGETGIDLLETARGDGPAVLFSLDSLRYPGLVAQLGALVLQDLRTVAGALVDRPDGRLRYLLIDEFGAFSGPQVLALLARGREAGFCCVLATQDLADVAAAGGATLVDQVLANTNVKLLLRQDVEGSARRLAAAVGTRETWQPTHRARHGWPTGDASLRPVERLILEPSLLQRLPPHQAVLVRKAPTLAVRRLRLRAAPEG